jgi:hypothetical protein
MDRPTPRGISRIISIVWPDRAWAISNWEPSPPPTYEIWTGIIFGSLALACVAVTAVAILSTSLAEDNLKPAEEVAPYLGLLSSRSIASSRAAKFRARTLDDQAPEDLFLHSRDDVLLADSFEAVFARDISIIFLGPTRTHLGIEVATRYAESAAMFRHDYTLEPEIAVQSVASRDDDFEAAIAIALAGVRELMIFEEIRPFRLSRRSGGNSRDSDRDSDNTDTMDLVSAVSTAPVGTSATTSLQLTNLNSPQLQRMAKPPKSNGNGNGNPPPWAGIPGGNPNNIPEPGSAPLMALGLAWLGWRRRRASRESTQRATRRMRG